MESPSFLALNPQRTVLYAVEEQNPAGALHALRLEGGGLTPVQTLSTQGADPCHISLDPSGRCLLVSNYTSGSLAVFRAGEGGLELSQLERHRGRGPHPTRQEGPHVHFSQVRGGEAFVADLGLDRVFRCRIDPETGRLEDTGAGLALPAGSGPRHLAFGPSAVYVVCELSNQVAVFRREGEGFVLKQLVSTLPPDFTGQSKAAAVKLARDLLFVSNRGHDSAAVFRVLADGLLRPLPIVSTGGRSPRDLAVFGDFLAAANQDSDSVTLLRIDWTSGRLEPTGIFARTPSPCCLAEY